MLKHKVAIVLFGAPGSGKTTQANLLSQKLDLVHFDTGKILERGIYVTGELKKYRKDFESGKLVPSEAVSKLILGRVERAAELGEGIVFSGSPRTLEEAKLLLPDLTRLYGKKNIYIFAIKVPERISVDRNSARLMCKECGAPLLTEYYEGKPKNCPICGGKLYKRTVDKPGVIQKRLVEYHDRTVPIFDFSKENGYNLIEVDGKPAPYKVFEKIYGHLKNA